MAQAATPPTPRATLVPPRAPPLGGVPKLAVAGQRRTVLLRPTTGVTETMSNGKNAGRLRAACGGIIYGSHVFGNARARGRRGCLQPRAARIEGEGWCAAAATAAATTRTAAAASTATTATAASSAAIG